MGNQTNPESNPQGSEGADELLPFQQFLVLGSAK